MRRILALVAFSSVFSILAFAENYSGKLLDASCFDQKKTSAGCDATSKSKAFALDVSGAVYKLDAAGNTKAAEALKNRADRAADPNKPGATEVMANVSGTEKGGTIAVQSIQVQ
jgi:hypothetical protein